jgi:uncharacterized membrane protein
MQSEDLMKLLGGLGGVISLIEAIIGLVQRNLDTIKIIILIIAIIIAVIILLSIIRPNNPIPLNWILFVVSGIIMIVYTSVIGGILVLVGGFVGYTER